MNTDSKGNLIIVHKKGIDILNPGNFYLLSYGNDMGIGIIDLDVNVINADNKGNVWIEINNDIIRLKPEHRVGLRKSVRLINKVLCFLEKVATGGNNVFEYNRNHLSFNYTVLWYAGPDIISCQYQLEGYNQEWITTRDRFVTFPNLQPGIYSFMLRSSINNNFSYSDIVSYRFNIKYPFWKRNWFIFMISAIMIFSFYRYPLTG